MEKASLVRKKRKLNWRWKMLRVLSVLMLFIGIFYGARGSSVALGPDVALVNYGLNPNSDNIVALAS